MVLNDPYGPANQVILAPVCSVGTKTVDDSCLLAAGEHEFIKQASYVAYNLCRIEEAGTLDRGLKKGLLVGKAAVSEELFTKIVRGLHKSKFTKPFTKTFLNEANAPPKKPAAR
ncbi:MAG: hypothetical protein ABI885_22700 [Gammaproteobacteria bacterium]